MKSKKIIIVGASTLQIPMIKKAKELGYKVGVVDYNPNAPGIEHADRYFNVSTIDPEGVCRATKEFKADGITTVGTDVPMRAIAYTCSTLGLIGITEDTAYNATDKARMIKKFEKFNVPHPWYYVVACNDYKELKYKLSFPCICKPIDNSASRGVIVINDERELKDGMIYSSSNGRSGTVLIEQLLVGSEISVEAFVIDGMTHILAITDKLTTGPPHFVEMGHSQPSKFRNLLEKEILKVSSKAISAMGIKNGPAHVEMMITNNGPVLIEIGARLGGDYITTDLVPLSTGIDMLAATIQLTCGEIPDITRKYSKASSIRYMKTNCGIIKSIKGVEHALKVEGVKKIEILKSIGEKAPEICNSIDRIGYVIAQGDTVQEAESACSMALKDVKIMVE